MKSDNPAHAVLASAIDKPVEDTRDPRFGLAVASLNRKYYQRLAESRGTPHHVSVVQEYLEQLLIRLPVRLIPDAAAAMKHLANVRADGHCIEAFLARIRPQSYSLLCQLSQFLIMTEEEEAIRNRVFSLQMQFLWEDLKRSKVSKGSAADDAGGANETVSSPERQKFARSTQQGLDKFLKDCQQVLTARGFVHIQRRESIPICHFAKLAGYGKRSVEMWKSEDQNVRKRTKESLDKFVASTTPSEFVKNLTEHTELSRFYTRAQKK